MTTKAATIPDIAPGSILTEDYIRQGSRALFAGHSGLKTLIWVVLPLGLLGHFIVVALVTNGALFNYFASPVKLFGAAHSFYRRRHGTFLQLLRSAVPCSAALGCIGVAIMLLNLSAEHIYAGKDADPLLRTTTAQIAQSPSLVYQYLWSFLSCLALTCTAWMLQRIGAGGQVRRAQRVYSCLHQFLLNTSTQHRAFVNWKASSGLTSTKYHVSIARQCCYKALIVLMLVFASAPAVAYVLITK